MDVNLVKIVATNHIGVLVTHGDSDYAIINPKRVPVVSSLQYFIPLHRNMMNDLFIYSNFRVIKSDPISLTDVNNFFVTIEKALVGMVPTYTNTQREEIFQQVLACTVCVSDKEVQQILTGLESVESGKASVDDVIKSKKYDDFFEGKEIKPDTNISIKK